MASGNKLTTVEGKEGVNIGSPRGTENPSVGGRSEISELTENQIGDINRYVNNGDPEDYYVGGDEVPNGETDD